MRLYLAGPRAGQDKVLHGVPFVRGIAQVRDEDEGLIRYLGRYYQALPEGSPELEEALNKFSAHSQTGHVMDGSIEKTADSLWNSTESKDKLFMFLLILNTVLMIGLAIACVVLNKSRNSKKYQEIYSSQTLTDDENEQLKR